MRFKYKDRERAEKTTRWIVAEAERRNVKRAVICGDVLTRRNMNTAHTVRDSSFLIEMLSEAVSTVHFLPGNRNLDSFHNCFLRNLESNRNGRRFTNVVVHRDIAQYEWDGRRVLILPFSKDQGEVAKAVAGIPVSEANQTVAFGCLSINQANRPRRAASGDVNSYHNHRTMAPHELASLARTFVGHHRPYQIITQGNHGHGSTNLQGSITYLGSPLQMGWADLHADQRGVLVLDSDSLEQTMLVSPHAIGYVSVDGHRVIREQFDGASVTGKNVMVTGNLSYLNYDEARRNLFAFGARSVVQMDTKMTSARGLVDLFKRINTSGATGAVASSSFGSSTERTTPKSTGCGTPTPKPITHRSLPQLDLEAEITGYVQLIDSDSPLVSKKNELIRTGQQILQVARDIVETGIQLEPTYSKFVDRADQAIVAAPATHPRHVFVAEPCTVTITNFLGVQGTINIDFKRHISPGITFVVGNNGSGKSTILEAMVWCQFGKLIRDGMYVKDVVNDIAGKDCSVKLEFSNGNTISRFRNHKVYKNRVIIKLNGKTQPGFEYANPSTTQKAINELLGIDYDTYVKTVVLSQDSPTGFLNSTQAQWRCLIEKALGLSILDQCEKVLVSILKDTDAELSNINVELQRLVDALEEKEEWLKAPKKKFSQLHIEAKEASTSLNIVARDYPEEVKAQETTPNHNPGLQTLQHQVQAERELLQRLITSHDHQQDKQRHQKSKSWLDFLFMALKRMYHMFSKACGFTSQPHQVPKNDHAEAVHSLYRDINASQNRLRQLESEEKAASLRDLETSAKLAEAIHNRSQFEAAQHHATIKHREAESQKDLATKEQLSLSSLQSERASLSLKLGDIEGRREVLAFWLSSLTKCSSGTSLQSSSFPGHHTETVKLREYIQRNALKKLTIIIEEVLEVLYGDARHAYMATGLLRSLFNTGSEAVLQPSFVYSKRSSGERKRINLALFFTLTLLGRATGGYHSRYVLVDEAFDSLDCAGQAAVVRWFSSMSAIVPPYIIVVTHSQFLAEKAVTDDHTSSRVLKVKMGLSGTELYIDSCRIGIN